MLDIALPVLTALFVWWFSTGAILYLDGLPRSTYRWSMLGATAVLAVAVYGLARTSEMATVPGAYAAFICAVLVWGWLEMAFLMGFITGPRRTACPPGCSGWRRFTAAAETVIHHEVAIAAAAAALVVLTWGDANQVGLWTFLILWGMRISAKLNLYLGVPNLSEEFFPDHLRYLKSYLRRRPMNALFPVSITASTAIAALFVWSAAAPGADPFTVAGSTFLATLAALAVLEHWALVLPLPVEALWRWGFQSRAGIPALEADLSPRPLGNLRANSPIR